MAGVRSLEVESIRDVSRRLVRELGFIRDGLAGTPLPPSAVHAMLEVEKRGPVTAAELSELLALEKSSVSRMLHKLVDAGELAEAPGAVDGRTKLISLTAKGQMTLRSIHRFARKQVTEALERLDGARRRTVTEGLHLYAEALAKRRTTAEASPTIAIEIGYRPGCLARCAELHAQYYAEAAGFGREFEALVASGVAEFSARLDRSCNRLWLATLSGEVVGTIAIDGEDLGGGLAHLRWFIVDNEVRGRGVGKRLLTAALDFCDEHKFAETHLWTFRGLDAARHLYESHGFALSDERLGQQWAKEVMEQRFVRLMGN